MKGYGGRTVRRPVPWSGHGTTIIKSAQFFQSANDGYWLSMAWIGNGHPSPPRNMPLSLLVSYGSSICKASVGQLGLDLNISSMRRGAICTSRYFWMSHLQIFVITRISIRPPIMLRATSKAHYKIAKKMPLSVSDRDQLSSKSSTLATLLHFKSSGSAWLPCQAARMVDGTTVAFGFLVLGQCFPKRPKEKDMLAATTKAPAIALPIITGMRFLLRISITEKGAPELGTTA